MYEGGRWQLPLRTSVCLFAGLVTPVWLGEVTQALQPSARLLSALSVLGYRPALSGWGALQGSPPPAPGSSPGALCQGVWPGDLGAGWEGPDAGHPELSYLGIIREL